MTTEEEFEKWWDDPEGADIYEKKLARSAYFAATKATALRCMEICTNMPEVCDLYAAGTEECAEAIKREFGLEEKK